MTGHTLIHQAFEYSSQEEFVAAMAPFLRDGRERGDRLFAATGSANIAALREELGEEAAAVDFRKAEEWYAQPYRTLSEYRRYVEEHGNGRTVRVIGEPVWRGRSAAATREWARYESALNVAFDSASAWIVCPYDTAALPEEIVGHARRAHPEVIVDGAARASDAFLPPRRFFESISPPEEPVPAAALRVEVRGGEVRRGELRRVRRLLSREAREAGLDEGRAADLVLAANELVTNGVRHGRPPVVLSLWRDGPEVVFEVEDCGPGFADPLTGCFPPPPDAISGRGVWMARLLCDSLDVVPAGDRFALRARLSLG